MLFKTTASTFLLQTILLDIIARIIFLDTATAAYLPSSNSNKITSPFDVLSLSPLSPRRQIIATGNKSQSRTCNKSQYRVSNGSTGRHLFSDDNSSAGLGFGQNKEKKSQKTDTIKRVVLDIPASKIKVGGLKFFLQLFILGEQNNPVKGSWALNINEEGDVPTLDVYYGDGTGMFSVIINERKITVERNGKRPSLQYQLQETVLLHGLLDELETVAYAVDDNGRAIDKEKRLLVFENDEDNTAISKVRSNLPAKKA